jgi:hypothetical protein
MSKAKTIDADLEAIAKEFVDEPKKVKKITIKQAPFDYGVRVDVIPGKEKVVWLLRNLSDEDFKYVYKAARQYRRADKTLNNIAE